jgi:hypothetical protein
MTIRMQRRYSFVASAAQACPLPRIAKYAVLPRGQNFITALYELSVTIAHHRPTTGEYAGRIVLKA